MNLLIVDDERYIVNYLFALIEEHIEIDLNIQKAYSGSEALEILSISKIDPVSYTHLDVYKRQGFPA